MKYLPGIVILSALVLAGCGATTPPQAINQGNGANQPTNAAPTQEAASNSGQMSLKDLMALGQSQKCTYSSSDNGQNLSGTILISGNKFKETTEITGTKGKTVAYAISDGADIYSWTDQTKANGIKMVIPTAAPDNGTPAAGQPAQGVDLNKKMDFQCTPTIVSAADLAVPGDVKFTDLSSLQNQLKGFKIPGQPNQGTDQPASE